MRRINERRVQASEIKERADKLLSQPNLFLSTLAQERELIDLNAFELTLEVAAHKINIMCINLKFMKLFGVESAQLQDLFRVILSKYRSSVHYHSYRHAFQVSNMMYHMLIDANIESRIRPIDKMALVS